MAIPRSRLLADLRNLGVRDGDTLMVHAALRSAGPFAGGAATVVRALLDAVGPEGALVAYVDFEPFYSDGMLEIPVFDKHTARAALDHGVLAEAMRTWPGAIRSDHPDAGVVAIGARARQITQDHPLQYGYGPGSPFERLIDLGGYVLMLGAPLDTVTLLHYAEDRANIAGKRIIQYRRLMPAAQGSEWVRFEEFDTSRPVCEWLEENYFETIVREYLSSGHGRSGPAGNAASYLLEAASLVRFAIAWLERRARPL